MNKHKKAVSSNLRMLEERLANIEEDPTNEDVAEMACLALSIPVHAVLYVGDAVNRVVEAINALPGGGLVE